MDPRKSRFSPYEVRGGGPGGRQGFRTNQAGMQHPHPQHAPRDEFYGRERKPLFNDKMSGGGGAMMRPKGSYSRGGGNDARFQHERGGGGGGGGYSDFIQPSLSRASSSSSYHTAPARRAGNQSRWEPAKRHNNSWDDDRDSFSNSNEDRTSESRLPAHIEQRVAREKPCRTLFVRNIQYNLKAHEMKDMFEKFGEVKEVFNLIESRGMIFVTFYDIRAAENAKESTQGMFLANRRIDVHYSLPKEEEENVKCDRTKNQGTLLFTLKNTDGWLQDDQLYDYFAQFGEVKVIRTPHFKHHTENNERRQRFVEFYDSRACVHAYDSCHGHEYKGGRWDVSFFWDHTNRYRERSEAFAAKKERPIESRPAKPDRREPDRRPRRDFGGGGGGRPPRRHHDDERRGSYDDFGRARYEPDNRSMSPREDRAYNPEGYTSNEDRQRLEQAQKAQQLLTMFAQTQDEGGSGSLQQQQQVAPGRALQQSTYPPVHQRPIPPVSAPPPQAVLPPLPAGQPVATDQASQMQQLLGLLTQVAATQQQYQQQQQAQPPLLQQPVAVPPPVSQPPGDHQQPSAPITDPAVALNQLAQILQNQQHQQPQQPSYPPVSMPPGGWKSEPQ